jgi:hypothetical protein
VLIEEPYAWIPASDRLDETGDWPRGANALERMPLLARISSWLTSNLENISASELR